MAAPAKPIQPRLVFINGFHRSGTTVMTTAVTEALGGVTTTVGVLARHIPTLDAFLRTPPAETADRGADRLEVTPQTPEEYAFLLNCHTGARALYGSPDGVSVLRAHIDELAAEVPGVPIVLKNPWDVGHEAQMLADFPDAQIIILRRRLADVEQSVGRSLMRTSASAYARALEVDDEGHQRFQSQIGSPWRRLLLLHAYQFALRRRAYELAGTVRRLPADRIALVSYDELRADPDAGAAWAAHLIEPRALAQAFVHHAFAEQGVRERSLAVHRALDRRWRRTWADVREAQIRAGILPYRA